MRDRLQIIKREVELVQLKTEIFYKEFGTDMSALNGDVENASRCERHLRAIEEYTREISAKVSTLEYDRLRFLRDVRNLGPWAAAYLFNQPI